MIVDQEGLPGGLYALGGRILGMLALRQADSPEWVSLDEIERQLAVDRQALCDAIALQVARGTLATRGEWVRSTRPEARL